MSEKDKSGSAVTERFQSDGFLEGKNLVLRLGEAKDSEGTSDYMALGELRDSLQLTSIEFDNQYLNILKALVEQNIIGEFSAGKGRRRYNLTPTGDAMYRMLSAGKR